MFLLRCLVVFMAGMAMTLQIQAQSSSSPIQAKGAFDTRYTSSDARIVAFDDGVKTYISLPGDMKSQPVAVSVQTGREVLIAVTPMSPYWMLDGVHAKIKLLWSNNKAVLITFTGTLETGSRLGSPAAFGHLQPASVHASAPPPVLVNPKVAEEVTTEIQDRLKQIAERDRAQAAVIVTPVPEKSSTSASLDVPSKLVPLQAVSTIKSSVMAEPANPAPAAQQPLSAQALADPSPLHLGIESGQRMSVAVQAWLAAQGVSLVWDVSAGGERLRDIEMIAEWQSPTPDIEKTLTQLLPAFGLRAIVQDNPRAVIVRPTSGSALKTTGAAK